MAAPENPNIVALGVHEEVVKHRQSVNTGKENHKKNQLL